VLVAKMAAKITPTTRTCLRRLFTTFAQREPNYKLHSRATDYTFARWISVSSKYLDNTSNFQGFNKKNNARLQTTQRKSFQTSAINYKKDYYQLLGVQKTASASDIKKAYYQLAKKFHPDTNKDKNSAEKFQEVQQAYEILSDDKKRSAYDQFGQTDFSGAGGGRGGQDPFGGGGPFQGMNVDDIFKEFFGQQGASGAGGFSGFEQARATQNYILSISFMDSVLGVNKDIRVSMNTICGRCNGRKAEPGSTLQTCPKCNGSGEEHVSAGFFNMRSTCRRCKGQGSIIKDPCKKCNGKGTDLQNQTVTVPVPAGIEDGQTVRVPISYGEMFVTFKVAESKIFQRVGSDVHTDVSVSFAQAILGGTLTVPGLYGDVQIRIPPGTQSHQQLRLLSKGIARLNGYGKGDHYIQIKIHLPKYLTGKQRELIEEFAATDESIRGTVQGLNKEKYIKKEKTMKNKKADEKNSEKETLNEEINKASSESATSAEFVKDDDEDNTEKENPELETTRMKQKVKL